MDTEEVRKNNDIRDIARELGIRVNKHDYCRCLFHSEKTASMKLYKDSFYCFGCHEYGDVIKFVQKASNCDFKTAFTSLGGTCGKQTVSEKFEQYKRHRNKLERIRKDAEIRQEITYLSDRMETERIIYRVSEVFSDSWCTACNDLFFDYQKYSELMSELKEGEH